MKNIKKIAISLCYGIVLCAPAMAQDLSQLISPVSNPTVFEDPRNSTELRPIYIYHKFDDKFVTGGGDINIYALQARFAVSEDLSIIATKDGYVDMNPSGVVPKDEGFANLGGGVKYTVARCDNYITSIGLRYEAPTGEKEVLEGQGDGSINPFLSTGYVDGNWNFIGSTGFRVAIDDDDSSFYDLNGHASYKIGNFYPLVELNLVTVIDEGNRLPIADEAPDFFNLGASNSSGETTITAAIGARYRITDDIDFGAAYQLPIDKSEGTRVSEYRVTTDFIFRF